MIVYTCELTFYAKFLRNVTSFFLPAYTFNSVLKPHTCPVMLSSVHPTFPVHIHLLMNKAVFFVIRVSL